MAQWLSLCIISHNMAAFGANCIKFTEAKNVASAVKFYEGRCVLSLCQLSFLSVLASGMAACSFYAPVIHTNVACGLICIDLCFDIICS